MKFFNITNIDGFFKIIDQCKGRVELVTEEGDRLNLKSRLSRVIAYANVFSGGTIDEMEILTSDPDDQQLLMNYLFTGEQ